MRMRMNQTTMEHINKCKLEYQGYDVRVVLVDLVLGVVSSGRGQSRTTPG